MVEHTLAVARSLEEGLMCGICCILNTGPDFVNHLQGDLATLCPSIVRSAS
jgi:hypothetical protein